MVDQKFSKDELMRRRMYTTAEFTKLMGWKSQEVARQCARRWIDPRTNRESRLPDDWTAELIDGRWKYFKTDEPDYIEPVLPRSYFQAALVKFGLNPVEAKDIEQSSVLCDQFESIRLEVMAKLLGLPTPSLLDDRKRKEEAVLLLRTFVKGVLSTMSDAELINTLLERWYYLAEIEKPEDLKEHFDFLCGDAKRRIGLGKRLVSGSRLFASLREHYRFAVKRNTASAIRLEFQPDGRVLINGCDISGDFDPGLISMIGDDIEDLFSATWKMQLAHKEHVDEYGLPSASITRLNQLWLRSSKVMNHLHCEHLHKRCWHCGFPLNTSRSNRFYCGENHKAAHSKWLKELVAADPKKREVMLSSRIKTISQTLRSPLVRCPVDLGELVT